MLPLWIIDITSQHDRNSHFCEIVGQLHGIYMPKRQGYELPADPNFKWLYTHYDNPYTDAKKKYDTAVTDINKHTFKKDDGNDTEDENFLKKTFEEVNHEMADVTYGFQEKIVSDAQFFIKMLRKSRVSSYTTLNICILGDSMEAFSQMVFSSLAIMLQKEKGRIVPEHIHQGWSIVGTLFIPVDINTRPVGQRQMVQHMLKEIKVQHELASVRGYDHIFFWQDMQNRTENSYPLLDERGQAEYLAQSLIHLYFACSKDHPLISGSSSDEQFYFTMGASSIFFDNRVQDEVDQIKVCNGILHSFKERGDMEQPEDVNKIIENFDEYSPRTILKGFTGLEINLDAVDPIEPNPHPWVNPLHRNLKRYYYEHYLKFYPAELRMRLMDIIEEQSSGEFERINNTGNRMLRTFSDMTMPAAIKKQIATCNEQTGGIQRIINNIDTLKNKLGANKDRHYLSKCMEELIWHPIRENSSSVPEELRDAFDQYHEAYNRDINGNSETYHQFDQMKEAATHDLMNNLKQEASIASRVSRSVFLGIIAVLSIMPLLELMSPDVINLGNVKKNAAIFASIAFLIPAVWQLVALLLYQRSRCMKIRNLKACYLHEAYSRIANRVESEAIYFYDKAMALCDEYIARCKSIQHEIEPFDKTIAQKELDIPVTQFNQPLVGGMFSKKIVLPENEAERLEIKVNHIPHQINELDKADHYSLIRLLKEEFYILFSDVKTPQLLPHRFDETLGENVYITREEAENIKRETWEENKKLFREKFKKAVADEMLPRRYPTLGEKIVHYYTKNDNLNILIPFIENTATNAEVTASADYEYADIKTNVPYVEDIVRPYLPLGNLNFQYDEYDDLYGRYLFLTRWRTFNELSYNRIFPMEDFDMEINTLLVNQDEQEMSTRIIPPSTLILWAMCSDDNSSLWLSLINNSRLSTADDARKIYKQKLNSKD